MASEQHQMIVSMLRSRPTAVDGATPEEMRAGLAAMTAIAPPAGDVAFEPVDAGGVPAAWVAAPGATREAAILYLHGGGYVVGSIHTHRDLVGRLSRAAGVRALSVDYRLAPEHPFPAAVDDA